MLDIEGKLQVLDPDTTYDVNSEISKRLLQKMVEDDPEKKWDDDEIKYNVNCEQSELLPAERIWDFDCNDDELVVCSNQGEAFVCKTPALNTHNFSPLYTM